MPGTTVITPTQWKSKLSLVRKAFDGEGTVTVPLKANISLPDGTPLNIAATGVTTECSASLVPNAISIGNLVGGATDGAEKGDVFRLEVGDKLRGILVEAIPASWYEVAIGLKKGAGAAGYTFATSGFITGTDVFKLTSLRGAAVGDENAQVEVEFTA